MADSPDQHLLYRFCKVAVLFGRHYLACGGPISRLENRLVQTAHALGIHCEVFALPTSLFVNARDDLTKTTVTLNGSIKRVDYDLQQMVILEKFLPSLAHGEISLREANPYLKQIAKKKDDYPFWLRQAGPFVIGFFACLPLTHDLVKSIYGGLTTLVIALIRSLLSQRLKLNETLADFFSSWFTFFIAALCSRALKVPSEVLALGSLLYLVPGLTLTTAVSELVDHNFLSGTTKLFRGALTLLSMGLAYLLFQELFTGLAANKLTLSQTASVPASFWLDLLSLTVIVMGFSIKFKVPKKYLVLATVIGVTGYVVLDSIDNSPKSYFVFASFASSFTVGILSLALGRWLHLPSQLFSVPGILGLVPGMLSFSVFKYMALEKIENVTLIIIQVILTCGAIVFGLLSARVPFLIHFSKKTTDSNEF